mgnify:CR=1 FL=1
MMLENYYAVIMAGGGGTRLWPLSRRARPKQMLSLFDERTLFQTAVERLEGIFPPERILVVTVEEQAMQLYKQCPFIPWQNFLIEPLPRGTASVVGMAAVELAHRQDDALMAVVTADHVILNVELFKQLLLTGHDVAEDGYLVTLGIRPTFAATGFGYIQLGETLTPYRGREVYRIAKFKEKPAQEEAERMLETGDHVWNSGMFFWRVDRILQEFNRQMPELSQCLDTLSSCWDSPGKPDLLHRVWESLKPQTVDYGIMEGAEQAAVIPAEGLQWSDVGSWDSLFDILNGDEQGNIVMGGKHVGLDTRNSLVYVNQEHRLIVTIGVENLVVVDTGDVLLVCRKDQAQQVRSVVEKLQKDDQEYI